MLRKVSEAQGVPTSSLAVIRSGLPRTERPFQLSAGCDEHWPASMFSDRKLSSPGGLARARPDAVYLRGDDWVAVDRWHVAVVGVFELVARHFAFDDPGICAGAARR